MTLILKLIFAAVLLAFAAWAFYAATRITDTAGENDETDHF